MWMEDPIEQASRMLREHLSAVVKTLMERDTTDLQVLASIADLAASVRRVGGRKDLQRALCQMDIDAGGVENGASLTAQALLALSADSPVKAAQQIMEIYEELESEASR